MKTKRITRYYQRTIPTKTEPEPELPLNVKRKSVIDKLGLGSEVLRLRKAGLTHEEIGIQLALSTTQVSDWLAKYREMSEQQKAAVNRRSVFDVADRVQEMFEHLYGILQDIKGENRELEVKTVDKLLKAISMAGDLIEKVELIKSNERFKETILDLLDQEAPGIKARALKRLSEYNAGVSALRPL